MNIYYYIATLIIFILSPIVSTKQVVCLVNNIKVATVDYDTGICPFQLPTTLHPSSSSSQFMVFPFFTFHSRDDYNVQFYYAIINSHRYTTDIKHGGSIISIAAKLLYDKHTPIYQVHLHKIPNSNSTEIIRKRWLFAKNKQIKLLLLSKILVKKDLVDDFIIDIAGSRGIMIDKVILSVVDVDQMTSSIATGTSNSLTRTGFTNPSVISTKTSNSQSITTTTTKGSSATTTTGTATGATETITTTKIITITSCSNDICHLTTVPASLTTVTTTGTVYTTYLPINSVETVVSTKIITITSCSNNNNNNNNNHVCHPTTVLATPSTMTKTIDNTITEYIIYCPLTQQPEQLSTINPYTGASATSVTATITSCWEETCQTYITTTAAATAVIITQTEITTVETVTHDTTTYYVTYTITSQTSNQVHTTKINNEGGNTNELSSSLPAITTTVEGRGISNKIENLLSMLIMVMVMWFV